MTRSRERWELEDPGRVLRAIDSCCPLRVGQVVVASLQMESQELIAAVVVPDPPESQRGWDRLDASHRLAKVAEQLVPPSRRTATGWSPATHLLLTVVCREGRVIDTITEHRWLNAWRFSDPLQSAVPGDVYVVTPHGWTGVMDTRAGRLPALRPRLALAPRPAS